VRKEELRPGDLKVQGALLLNMYTTPSSVSALGDSTQFSVLSAEPEKAEYDVGRLAAEQLQHQSFGQLKTMSFVS